MGKVKLGFDILINEWVAIKIIKKSENDYDFFELPNYKNITWKKHMSTSLSPSPNIFPSKRFEKASNATLPFTKNELNFLSLVKRTLRTPSSTSINPPSPSPNDKKSKKKKDLRVLREVSISQLVIHPHICELKDIIINSDRYYLISELVVGKQLLEIIVKNGKLDEETSIHYSRQIASALMYLHKHSIVHRDLKIENIMVNNRNQIKLIDFGLSNLFSAQKQLSTFCGSLYFAAPELLEAKQYYGPEIDCWSFGIIIYVLVCGKVPFDDVSISNLHARIKLGVFELPKFLSDSCKAIISSLIVVNPVNRATIGHAIASQWMNKGHLHPPKLYLPSTINVNPPLVHTSQIDHSIVQIISKHYSSCYYDGAYSASTEKIFSEIVNVINSDWYKAFLLSKYGKYISQMNSISSSSFSSKSINIRSLSNPRSMSIINPSHNRKYSSNLRSTSDLKSPPSQHSLSHKKKNSLLFSPNYLSPISKHSDARSSLSRSSFSKYSYTDYSNNTPFSNVHLLNVELDQLPSPQLDLPAVNLYQNDSSTLEFDPDETLNHIINNFSYLNGSAPILSIYYMIQAKLYFTTKTIENLELSYNGSDPNNVGNHNSNSHVNKPLPDKPLVANKIEVEDLSSSASSIFNQDTFYDSYAEKSGSDSEDESKPKERKLETFLETLKYLDANPNYFSMSSNPQKLSSEKTPSRNTKLVVENHKNKQLTLNIKAKIPKVSRFSTKPKLRASSTEPKNTRIPTSSQLVKKSAGAGFSDVPKNGKIVKQTELLNDQSPFYKEPMEAEKPILEGNRDSLLSLFSILNTTPSTEALEEIQQTHHHSKKKSGWFRSVLKKL
ncbi:Protein kinase kin1 [Smittium mucronatum]|uniref:Protein kinase kin1 n=1 Tax=Smittium mucronatum TaxID=133383 RepID=A0A1R0H673_9FUNG|nr:Protein kinase kin1 [Smittium mucronatum]